MPEREPPSPCISILVRNPGIGDLTPLLTNRILDARISAFALYSAEIPKESHDTELPGHEDVWVIAIDEFLPEEECAIRSLIEASFDVIDHDFSAYESPYTSQCSMKILPQISHAENRRSRLRSRVFDLLEGDGTSYQWN
ncbi:MAG: hypothetical protein PHO92_00950 [Candidatus Peribacteraceae bacterium]|nr:hypothetical protein [Candidatus Peribacteraceae bacterium]